MLRDHQTPSDAYGRLRLYSGGRPPVYSPNMALYGWGQVLSRDMQRTLQGLTAYGYNAVYFEFENVDAPGDRVLDAPELARTRTLDYFDGLSGHASRDYLRVPISASKRVNFDDEIYVEDNGIFVTARSRSVVGVHGKAFSEAANSVVFGAFLVSMENQADASKDLIAHGHYFDADEQQPKYDLKPVAVDWEVYWK